MVTYDRRKIASDHPTFKIEIEVLGVDAKNSLVKLLQFLKFLGGIGASRGIRTDDNDTVVAFWDGDGPDKINQILVNGIPIETQSDEKKKEIFNNAIK